MMPLEIEAPRLVARAPRADDVPALLARYGDPVATVRLNPDGSPRTEPTRPRPSCAPASPRWASRA